MPDPQPYYIFPRADNTTLLIAAAVFVGMLVGAFVLEGWRRRRERRKRLEAEWRAIDTFTKDRELTPKESATLKSLLERRAADRPFHAVTVRHDFDAVVDAEMDALARAGDMKRYEETGAALRDIRLRIGLDYVPIGQRIHSTRDLHPGQPVWIALDDAADKAEWHAMTVTEVDEARLGLVPRNAGAIPEFRPGERVKSKLWREEDARYRFSAPVLRTVTNPDTLYFLHTRELERTQSRAHFRIRHDQAIELAVVTAPVDKDESTVPKRPASARLRGRIVSLSGGGLAVVVSQPTPDNVYLRLGLDLDPEAEPLPVIVKLVDAAALPGGRYLLRGTFVLMDDDTRDIVTHFVFKHQTAATAPPTHKPAHA